MAVGQAVHMVDGRARVTGEIQYAGNLELPGMLEARVLRSPHPHARVLRVDTSRAEALPGVVAVLSRNDLVDQDRYDIYFGQIIHDQTPVAVDRVRFVGDSVAAVAALDADIAQQALDLIEVEYEELPAVFDPVEALEPGAPLLHEGPRRVVPNRPEVRARSTPDTNIVHLFTQRKGDAEQGFAESDHIFGHTYTTPVAEHVALEPHTAIAEVRDGIVTVWTASQSPHAIQNQIAQLFKVPISSVRVIVFTLGGAYGGKMVAKIEPIVAILAAKARRPVRLVLPRSDDFLISSQHSAVIKVKTGVKSDGRLLAQRTTIYYNAGPFADTTPNLITRGYAASGPYRVTQVHVDSYGVYTNLLPSGAFRGYGITQVAWAHESQMDVIADALGIDPLELRLKNVLHAGEPFTTGEPMPEMYYPELLRSAAEAIGWKPGELVSREGSKVRAKGIAAIIKGMASPTTSTCTVKLNADGSLSVLAGTVEMGQGSNTALAQIAATEAGVPLEKVRILAPDTQFTPFDIFTAASRSTYCMGMAIRLAADDVKDQLRTLAAARLEAGVEDLVVGDGRVSVRGVADRSVTYSQLIRESRQFNLLGTGTFVAKDTEHGDEVVLDLETGQGYGSAEWHPAVVACEVEVDTETGKVEVPRLHASLYAGKLINPRLCELQIEGSTIFGLGQALFEEAVFDGGQLTNANLSDYMIPSFEDVPTRLTVELLEPVGVTEVHGIGETALPPARPAIANAVTRAIGVRIFELPLTPAKVLEALDRAEAEGSAEFAVR